MENRNKCFGFISLRKPFQSGRFSCNQYGLYVLQCFFLGCNALKNCRVVYSYSQGNGDSPLRNTHGIIVSYRGGKGYSLK